MDLNPHGNEWYDRLSTLQRGYYYPWKLRIGEGDGETAFLRLVKEHLSPEKDVLDAGCGHGELTLALAPKCRSICGYDRVANYIRLARETAERSRVTNATFVEANSSPRASQGLADPSGKRFD